MSVHLSSLAIIYKEKLRRPFLRQFLRFLRRLPRMLFRGRDGCSLKVICGLTYRCPCSCAHCGMSGYEISPADELSTGEVLRLIEDVSALPYGLILFSFFGGEPLLREDLPLLVAGAVKRGLFTEIETSGMNMTPEKILSLKRAGLNHVFISLDSAVEERHDSSRGIAGAYRSALFAIENCRKNGLPFSLSVCVTETSPDADIRDLIALAKRHKAASVRLLCKADVASHLRGGRYDLCEAEAGAKNRLDRFLERNYVYAEYSGASTAVEKKVCPALLKWFFYVSCYGEIQPCPYFPYNFGNLRESSLEEVVKRMWSNKLFDCGSAECMTNSGEIKSRMRGLSYPVLSRAK